MVSGRSFFSPVDCFDRCTSYTPKTNQGRIKQSDGPFLLGEQLTIADLYIRAPLGDLFDLNQFEGVPAEFYAAFPRVQGCAAAVLEHPLLEAYHSNYRN